VNFQEAAAYMSGLLRFGVKLGNERFEALLERLGSPHHSLRAVHVAGTKGKGSTATFIASILRCSGYRVGVYLSPFVYNLRERIQIDGSMISEDEFAEIVTEIKPHIDEIALTDLGQVTEFELKTAVGFVYFARKNVDYAVIEVGLGGRLDATNVLPHPVVSVITNIGLDHTEVLGATIPLIAAEKAGIIKQNGNCVTGVDNRAAFEVIQGVAKLRDAALFRVRERKQWSADADGRLTLRFSDGDLPGIRLQMLGGFQKNNAALAAFAARALNDPLITPETIREGLEAANLPGRFEIISKCDPTVVVDVAHNELSAQALQAALISELSADKRPVVLVIGMSRHHDPVEFLGSLLKTRNGKRLKTHTLLASEPTFKPRRVEDIVSAASSLGVGYAHIESTVASAAVKAVAIADKLPNSIVLVTGSFYTVGDVVPEFWRNLLSTRITR
jgi:dihydrofolate synthase/folylpolyglutamate synthase